MDWVDFAVFFIIVLCVVWLISILLQDNYGIRVPRTVPPKERVLPPTVLRYREPSEEEEDMRRDTVDEDFVEPPQVCPCRMRMRRCMWGSGGYGGYGGICSECPRLAKYGYM